ncbi:MAG: calcium/sodium antiporter [Erythrobacter sp.]
MTEMILMILGGLVGLAVGGELLVRGAVGIALKAGLSHLVTGVVIIGAATSMPELVASVQASLEGSPDIAWGNIAGSNIANSLLILGGAALVAPIMLTGAGKRDAISGLAAVGLLWGIGLAGVGAIWIGGALLALLVAYIYWRVKHPSKAHDYEEEEEDAPDSIWVAIILFALGVGALILGGKYLVIGAIDVARLYDIPETVIGLTVVAIGTSLPELAATIAAALKGKSGLALGNVVGSNIFNLLLIGGATMVITPKAIPYELFDLEWPVLAATAVMLVLLCQFAKRIGRGLGVLLLAAFAINTAVLFA